MITGWFDSLKFVASFIDLNVQLTLLRINNLSYRLSNTEVRSKLICITNWKLLDVEYYDLVRVVEKSLHLIHDVLHGHGLEYSVVGPPHRVSVRIVSDPDIQIPNPVDQLREHVHVLQFNYPNDYQQRLFHM